MGAAAGVNVRTIRAQRSRVVVFWPSSRPEGAA